MRIGARPYLGGAAGHPSDPAESFTAGATGDSDVSNRAAWVRRILTGELIPMSEVEEFIPLGSKRYAGVTLRDGRTVAVEWPPRPFSAFTEPHSGPEALRTARCTPGEPEGLPGLG